MKLKMTCFVKNFREIKLMCCHINLDLCLNTLLRLLLKGRFSIEETYSYVYTPTIRHTATQHTTAEITVDFDNHSNF